MHHLLLVAIALTVLLCLAGFTVAFFRYLWKSPARLRGGVINATLLAFSLAFLLLAAEALIYQVAVYPDAFVVSLAAKRWYAEHWTPINRLGLRGAEPGCPATDGLSVLIVVGDSLTEGAGLLDYHDRFAERIKVALRGRWQVETLARAGWDTPVQMEQLAQYPCKPARVLLVYFVNDIKSAALAHEVRYQSPLLPLSPAAQWVVEHSYLANFAYYRLHHAWLGYFNETTNSPVLAAYENPAVWATHLEQIEAFIAQCRSLNAPLEVVLLPHLFAVEATRPITEKVQAAFEQRGVPTLNLTGHFTGRPSEKLTISNLDSHPNPATHAEIAAAVLERFKLLAE